MHEYVYEMGWERVGLSYKTTSGKNGFLSREGDLETQLLQLRAQINNMRV